MNKRVNFKLLGGLLGGSLLFAVVSYFLHDFQVKRNADALLVRAQERREEGDLSEAIRIMGRYLQHRPEDSVQLKVLALDSKKYLYSLVERRETPKKQMVDRAISLMEEAVRRNGTDAEVRREAADFWFTLRRYDYAIENLEVIKTTWTADDRMRYVDCLRLIGGPSETKAVDELYELVGYDPDTREFLPDKAQQPELLDAYQTLAALLSNSMFDNDLAERVLNQMIAVNGSNPKAYLIRARLLRQIRGDATGDQPKADIIKAFELAPGDIDVLSAMATMRMGDKDFTGAESLVRSGLGQATERTEISRLYNLLVQLEIQQGNSDKAFQVINEGLQKVSLDLDMLWYKARLLLDKKEHDKVTEMYSELRRAGLQEPMIAYLDSRIQLDNGDHLRASKNMERLRPLVATMLQYEVDVYLSTCYEVLGQADKRLETIDRILKIQPNNLPAQVNRVQTLAQLGRNSEALKYLRALQQAFQAAGESVPASIDQLELSLDLADLMTKPEEERDWKRVEQKVQQVWGNKDIPLLQKIILVHDLFKKEGKIDKAREWIDKGLAEDPDQFQLWTMQLDLAESQADAENIFAKMEQKFDDRVSMRALRAKLAIKYNRDAAGTVIQQQEKGAEAFPAEDQANLFYELGVLQLALDNRIEGLRLIEAASQKNPKRLDILSTLFDTTSQGDDPQLLASIVNRIEQITTKEDDTWRLHEARRIVWLIRKGTVPQENLTAAMNRARQLMQQVRSSRPGWLPVVLLESDIHRLSNDNVAAAESLEAALRLQPGNPNLLRILAQMYKDNGQVQLAESTMAKLPFSMRSDRDNRAQISLLVERGDPEATKEALRMLDEVVPRDSLSAQDQLWRARILKAGGDFAGAEQAARKTVELEPGLPDPWVMLVDALVRQDRKSDAEEVLQKVEIGLSPQVQPLVLGQCYSLMGEMSKAQQNYLRALQGDPGNSLFKRLLAATYLDTNDLQRGVALLQDILKNTDPAVDPTSLSWARRSLARILSNTESYVNFLKALELIEQNADKGELSGEDLSLWVFLCARRPEASSWQKAINRLEQIEEKRSLTDDELFFKAQLYEKFGDELWADVERITVELLARNQGNQTIIENWVKWLLKRGKIEDAEVWKRNLSPTSVTRVRTEVHALAKSGNHKQAAQKLNALVPSDLNNTESLEALLTVAGVAEELGQYEKGYYLIAENYIRKLTSKLPKESLRLASIMGMYGDSDKIKSAIDICLNAEQQEIPISFSAAIATAILRKHPDMWNSDLSGAVKKVEQWMDVELRENPQDFAMKIRVAEFHDVFGNLDRVEHEYTEILNNADLRNPLERGMILNNLAYAMALNGKTNEPLDLITQAEQLLGPSADIVDTRGYVHLVRGEVDKAVSDFQSAIDTGTRTGQKLFHLALALDKQGKPQEAGEAWQQALRTGLTAPKLPPALRGEFQRLEVAFGRVPLEQTKPTNVFVVPAPLGLHRESAVIH